jgi:glycosyltransferase involved in cell wall biosynthesis
MNELVTVVIPNRNGAKFIQDAVTSALCQEYFNIEVIVIDDGSEDNSLEVLNTFGSQITLLKTPNLGAASARNLGIKNANGEFIAFLDSDDYWSLDKIRLQMEEMKNGKFDLVYCAGESFGEKVEKPVHYIPSYSGDCYKFFKRYPTRAIIVLGCSGALIRKSVLNASGLFDETLRGTAEDWDFFRRYSKYSSVGYLVDNLVKYRIHAGNLSAMDSYTYYLGNLKAVTRMLFDDPSIRKIEKRWIWFKFQMISAKTFLRDKKYSLAFMSVTMFFARISEKSSNLQSGWLKGPEVMAKK